MARNSASSSSPAERPSLCSSAASPSLRRRDLLLTERGDQSWCRTRSSMAPLTRREAYAGKGTPFCGQDQGSRPIAQQTVPCTRYPARRRGPAELNVSGVPYPCSTPTSIGFHERQSGQTVNVDISGHVSQWCRKGSASGGHQRVPRPPLHRTHQTRLSVCRVTETGRPLHQTRAMCMPV